MSVAAPPTRCRAGSPPPWSGSRSGAGGPRRRSRRRRCLRSWRSPSQENVTEPAPTTTGLADAGLVHRRVAGRAGAGAGRQHVLGHLGALAGQRRGEDGVGVAVAAPRGGARRGARCDTAPSSSRRSSCDSRRSRPEAMRVGDLQRRARLAALDLAEHRRGDAAALGEVAQREVHSLAQRADAWPEDGDGLAGRGYVITYMSLCRKRPVRYGGRVAPP